MKTKQGQNVEFKYNMKMYWSFLRNYKLLIFGIIFIVFLLELRHVIDKYLFKIIIDKGTEVTAGTLAKTAFIDILIIIAIIFGAIIISGFVFRWLYTHLINILDSKLILDLKKKFFEHLITLDHRFHVTHKTGSLISRLMRGGNAMERMTDVIVYNFVPLFIQLFIVTFSLIYFDWVSAIIVFTTLSIFVTYSVVLQRIQNKPRLELNTAEDIEKGNISDIFTNIDSIKYFGKENLIKKKFLKLGKNTKSRQMTLWGFGRWFDSVQSLILGIGTFFLVYSSLMKFLDGGMTLGTLVFIYTVYGGIIGPTFGFVHGIRGFYRSMADFQDLFEYGKVEKEIKDKPGAKPLKINQGEIEFKNVLFRYDTRTLFRNFNLKIPKNKKVAFVGHSGCGKTTLVKLLYRFYDINRGQILIDNQDIRDVKQESLRSEMSVVPQEAVLFDDTIYNNIKFSNPKSTKKEVMKAIKFAQLDKIIRDFPNKENTIVGERGVKLSGGEKQRVSIARAILANKKILVLDEATSALDSETEHEIQRDLTKLMEGRTSLIIAHRLSTIMHADTIVVMKKGEIIQMGTHNQLIRQPGEYRKLWNLQKGGYIK